LIAAYLLPDAVGGWEPLGSVQWLGLAPSGITSPTVLPQATSPAAFGTTPFPTPTPAVPGQPVASPANPQGCGHSDTSPLSSRSLFTSTAAAAGTRGEVALTIDDGPNPIYTQQMIEILRAWHATATFFVVGVHAQRFSSLVQEEAADGFAIGNHTLTHADLLTLNPAAISVQISRDSQILRALTGNACLWLFREPYGDYNPTALSLARQQGFTSILWDVDGRDWTRPGPTAIVSRILANVHPGAIILIHDSAPDNEVQDRSQTVAALPRILAGIRARGLTPVTLPTLLSDAGYIHLQP
jgi:peptidoglycan/xylan/chitin deacetylase (PgdA/CDA1 family)